jgi:hypothetical protein
LPKRDTICKKQEALACARVSATDGTVAGRSRPEPYPCDLLNGLAVQGEIGAFALDLFLDTQADHQAMILRMTSDTMKS